MKSVLLVEELKTAERTEGHKNHDNPGHDHCKLINISPPAQNHHMRNLSQGVKNGRNTSPLQGFQTEDVILRVSSEVTITTKTSDDLQNKGSPTTMTKMAPTT